MQINYLSNIEMFFLADSFILSFLLIQEFLNITLKQSKKCMILTIWNHTCSSQSSKSEYKKKNQMFYCKYCKNSSYECQSTSTFQNYFFKKHDINIQSESCRIKIFSLLNLIKKIYYDSDETYKNNMIDNILLFMNKI